jgi:hypothetical protein
MGSDAMNGKPTRHPSLKVLLAVLCVEIVVILSPIGVLTLTSFEYARLLKSNPQFRDDVENTLVLCRGVRFRPGAGPWTGGLSTRGSWTRYSVLGLLTAADVLYDEYGQVLAIWPSHE